MPVAEALARVLEQAHPLPVAAIALQDAVGCVLAEDLAARRTQPPGDVSAMDGYAVRAADVAKVPVDLKVTGEVAAGRPTEGNLLPGCAIRIFTGGLVPEGADTIVIQENVDRKGDVITVNSGSPAGKHIRRAGIDFRTGDVLLKRGQVLTGRDISLAAAMNYDCLPVHRPPLVAVLATGDELLMPGGELGSGQIICSNNFSVIAQARSQRANTLDLGIAPDRVAETVAAIRRAREAKADILVTTGGASVGDYDLVHKALEQEGLKLSFWKIALRPGKPLMHGKLGDMHVLGLPGNPVSAFVGATLFLLPLIRKLLGRSDYHLPEETARIGRDLPENIERTDYMRAMLSSGADGMPVATPFGEQDSSLMQTLARADCLVIREPHESALLKGGPCRIIRLPF